LNLSRILKLFKSAIIKPFFTLNSKWVQTYKVISILRSSKQYTQAMWHPDNKHKRHQRHPGSSNQLRERKPYGHSSHQNNKRLFIGAIPYNISKNELQEYFQQFGPVTDLFLPFDKRKGSLKGFAFVEFHLEEDCLRVLQCPSHTLRGQMMVIRSAMDKERAQKSSKLLQKRKLFVKGFPTNTTEREIRQLFGQLGAVNRVLMAWSQGKRKFRGFCYIVMQEEAGFRRVVEQRNNMFFKGSKLQVEESKTVEQLERESKPKRHEPPALRPGQLEPLLDREERSTLWEVLQTSLRIRQLEWQTEGRRRGAQRANQAGRGAPAEGFSQGTGRSRGGWGRAAHRQSTEVGNSWEEREKLFSRESVKINRGGVEHSSQPFTRSWEADHLVVQMEPSRYVYRTLGRIFKNFY
jgi:RNA recognition motif-containing protein